MRKALALQVTALCLLSLAWGCTGARTLPHRAKELALSRDGADRALGGSAAAGGSGSDSKPPLLKRHHSQPIQFNNGSDLGNLTFDYYQALDIYYFATAAYCTASNIDAWDSGRKALIHPDVEAVVAYNTTVPLLWNIEKAPVLFFILYYPKNDTIVLSFQGTQGDSMGDWVDDFMFAMGTPPDTWGWPSGEDIDVDLRIEDGFAYAWDELRDQAFNLTTTLMDTYPSAKYMVTGHSLGGALASLAAADLALNGIPVDMVYLFGAPRAGNLGWAFFYNELLALKNVTYRLVNQRDPVPHIPYTGITFMRGYHHVGIEVWLKEYDFVQCNDVLAFEDCRFSPTCFYNEDERCSASQSICLTPTCIHMHLGYFNEASDDKLCKAGC
mmetsp:Transcript_9591/g.23904  ORF Transcript_9591/g.23904 Transcript_9591/m.23904 type:complete len:384 (+) Transcript_9591:88-1239(+)